MQCTSHSSASLVLSCLLSLTSGSAAASDSVAYYSDSQNDRVLAFDPVEMRAVAMLPVRGNNPYPIGKASDRTSYISTRDSRSIDVLNNFDVINGTVGKQTVRKIQLKHTPRSFAYGSARAIAVVSGNSEPWATLLLPTDPGNAAVQSSKDVSISDTNANRFLTEDNAPYDATESPGSINSAW